jgi:hypothetical protein
MTETEQAFLEYFDGIKAAHKDPPAGLTREERRAWSDYVDARYIIGTAAIDALPAAEPEAGVAKAFCGAIETRTAYGNLDGNLDLIMDALLTAMSAPLRAIAAELRALTENPPLPAHVIGESPGVNLGHA